MNNKLREARLAKGWTQEETADRARIGRSTYLRIEQESQQPHEDTIDRLCTLFDQPREALGFPPKQARRRILRIGKREK